MNGIKKKFILASLLGVSLVALFGVAQQQISADEDDERQYPTANDIEIHTVFSFRDAVEESDSFQIYDQVSGFDRGAESPVFTLQGAVDYDRVHLYEAADMTFLHGPSETNHDYGQFDVDVYLHKDGTVFRYFKYSDCSVISYKVQTLFDKEEGWFTSKGFATVDQFQFACNGYKPNNPVFDAVNSSDEKADTQSSLDLKNTQTWADSYRQ
ncbi:MAG: hypothetical protein GKS07_08030 [Nitrosopumilus sp.]|nr:MAG: hypothetical protein GKS07_00035 [Nitrosopumilus sp.]QMU54827.1 MAG: hypothetical protein GKS07_08030 [Nitrosopumilus sp.]